MEVIHFGAGNIGKGFIANILSHNNFQICFVDIDPDNINIIKKNKSYFVEILEPNPKVIEIKNIDILDSIHEPQKVVERIINADLITTSVGVNNLVKIVPIIIQGLITRFKHSKLPINIIANENAINATNILKHELITQLPFEHTDILQSIGFVNSAIDRQAVTRQFNETQITAVEPFWEWVINQKEMVDMHLPKIGGVTYVDNLQPYIEKKLYLVNLGHATLAYLGFIANQVTIFDTLSNPTFKQFTRLVMQSSSQYLTMHYSFKKEYLSEYIDNTLIRFANPHIKDNVLRVAQSPIRKLKKNERLVGPLLQLYKRKLSINPICKVIAMVLFYNNQTDIESIELQNFLHLHGVKKTVINYCQIECDPIISLIKYYHDMLTSIMKCNSKNNFIKEIENFLLT